MRLANTARAGPLMLETDKPLASRRAGTSSKQAGAGASVHHLGAPDS